VNTDLLFDTIIGMNNQTLYPTIDVSHAGVPVMI